MAKDAVKHMDDIDMGQEWKKGEHFGNDKVFEDEECLHYCFGENRILTISKGSLSIGPISHDANLLWICLKGQGTKVILSPMSIE